MNQQSIITAFDQLTTRERAEVLDELWRRYEENFSPTLSPEEVAELDRRMAAYRRDPDSAFDAEEVCDEMVRLARDGE